MQNSKASSLPRSSVSSLVSPLGSFFARSSHRRPRPANARPASSARRRRDRRSHEASSISRPTSRRRGASLRAAPTARSGAASVRTPNRPSSPSTPPSGVDVSSIGSPSHSAALRSAIADEASIAAHEPRQHRCDQLLRRDRVTAGFRCQRRRIGGEVTVDVGGSSTVIFTGRSSTSGPSFSLVIAAFLSVRE